MFQVHISCVFLARFHVKSCACDRAHRISWFWQDNIADHILESPDHGMKFAIIENEFGEVGVDENIIKEDSEEQIIEVSW